MNKYDLAVIGGGTAGVAAAYIAAKNGLKTIIIEKNIHLGGSITSALVIPAMKSNTKDINCEFYNDFIEELQKMGGQITYGDGNKGWFNPEISKIALDNLISKVGCDVIFNATAKEANTSKNEVKQIVIDSNMLSLHIDSLYFVDTTGDGNFSQLLKIKNLDNNHPRQPMNLRFNISGINLEKFSKWILELDSDRDVTTVYNINNQIHLSTACTWDKDRKWSLWPIFQRGIDNNEITEEDASYFQIFTIPGMKDTISLNCPRIVLDGNCDPLDAKTFSSALIKGRQQIWRIFNFLKKNFVGFENSYISNIADMMGIRESRRITGEKVYTKSDILSGKTLKKPVLHADYPIDIHSHKKDSSTLQKTTVDYELPIECLKTKEYKNLYIAGRCLSADFDAQAALRIQTSCFSMGEAIAKDIKEKLK